MIDEARGRRRGAASTGEVVEIYHWTRELALRIALRGLLGLDATGGREQALAKAFEESLAIHGEPVLLQLLPLPRNAARPARSPPARGSTRWCARRSRSAGAAAIRAGACSGCCWPPPTTPARRSAPTWSATRRSRSCSPGTTRPPPRSRSCSTSSAATAPARQASRTSSTRSWRRRADRRPSSTGGRCRCSSGR